MTVKWSKTLCCIQYSNCNEIGFMRSTVWTGRTILSPVLNCSYVFCYEGKSGLDELHVMVRKSNSGRHADVNERFHQFSSVLFSSCIDFERSIQTREVNDRLDRVIRSFLIEVSAYLYMKPTKTSPPHKALEWLVHRFCFITCIWLSCASIFNFSCCFWSRWPHC